MSSLLLTSNRVMCDSVRLSLVSCCVCFEFFFFKQKTAYEMRISDWSSDVCSSDLAPLSATATRLPSQPPSSSPGAIHATVGHSTLPRRWCAYADDAAVSTMLAIELASAACIAASGSMPCKIGRASRRERVRHYV